RSLCPRFVHAHPENIQEERIPDGDPVEAFAQRFDECGHRLGVPTKVAPHCAECDAPIIHEERVAAPVRVYVARLRQMPALWVTLTAPILERDEGSSHGYALALLDLAVLDHVSVGLQPIEIACRPESAIGEDTLKQRAARWGRCPIHDD